MGVGRRGRVELLELVSIREMAEGEFICEASDGHEGGRG